MAIDLPIENGNIANRMNEQQSLIPSHLVPTYSESLEQEPILPSPAQLCLLALIVMSILLLIWNFLNTPVSNSFGFPGVDAVRKMPKPDLNQVPAYPSIIGQFTTRVDRDFPCSIQKFQTPAAREEVLQFYLLTLQDQGWEDTRLIRDDRNKAYYRNGFTIEVGAEPTATRQTSVQIELCKVVPSR